MKKKLLPLAMLAGLAGTAGTAEAVYLNSDGLGEALIYPFYSVEGGQDTYFTVVNTTNLTKAVKVRIIEAMNSAEVLDFNLYLSPFDHWAGAITITDDGAKLVTGDLSCTVPAIPADGVAFRDVVYNAGAYTGGAASDGGPTTLDRTREGYIEILEMGVLDDSETIVHTRGDGTVIANFAEAAATHVAGVPANCNALLSAWIPTGSGGSGEWATRDSRGAVLPVTAQGDTAANFSIDQDLLGGLYGYGVLINVNEGTNATYSAIALDAFFPLTPINTDPGTTSPSLGQADAFAEIFNSVDGTVESLEYFTAAGGFGGIDAVSAVFMHESIANDYVMAPSIAAGTDWVITMPTKRAYVNTAAVVRAPFTRLWSGTGTACEGLQLEYWDREERQDLLPPPVGAVDFSPRPPQNAPTVAGFQLCTEVSVISFIPPTVDTSDALLPGYVSAVQPSENIQHGFQPIFDNGWARLSMATDNSGVTRELVDDNGVVLAGLPTVGFAVQKYANGAVDGVDGGGAFYAGLIEHKYTRNIDGVSSLPGAVAAGGSGS